MLRIEETFGMLPVGYLVDESSMFQPGQIASLKIKNDQLVVGVSDGLNPFGVFDDIRSHSIRKIVICEQVALFGISEFNLMFSPKYQNYVIKTPIKIELNNPDIVKNSFISYGVDVMLDAKNGVITIPAETPCNAPSIGKAKNDEYPIYPINDSFKFQCSYAYNETSKELIDTTVGSHRVTVWNKNLIARTDMYDVTQDYKKYTPLYVDNGYLTSRKIIHLSKCVGMVLEEPTPEQPSLKFLLDLEGKLGAAK